MGVAISTQSPLAPISLASSVIGFVSFAFTVATALRVFWSNLYVFESSCIAGPISSDSLLSSQTVAAAGTEIHDYLSNLRQSLYEERSHLRKARKLNRRRRNSGTARGEKDGTEARQRVGEVGPEAAVLAMSTAVRHMCEQFKELERPFVKDPTKRPARRAKDSWVDEGGYSTGGLGEDEGTDYLYTESRYKKCGIKQRLIWLKTKASVVTLLEAVNRMEVRRIGMQVTQMANWTRDIGRNLDHLDDRLDALDRLEQRLSRIVGIRRVD